MDRDYEYEELKKSNQLLLAIHERLAWVVMWLGATYVLLVIKSFS